MRYLASGAQIVDEGIQVSEVSLGNPDDLKPGDRQELRLWLQARARDPKARMASSRPSSPPARTSGCTVALDAAAKIIRCPCHGGTYDPATGKNVGGPPPRPLEKLSAIVEGGKLVVRKGGA